jgi:aspartyl-tRNA(Asn)/glutamyl-tRNA(Gln) amidotransferase subunit C
MPPKLSTEDVRHIASLARLELTPAETAQFADQLARVLDFAVAIEEIDTTGIEPTASLCASTTVMRDDEPRPSADRTVVLAAAPDADRTAGLFRVPKVL